MTLKRIRLELARNPEFPQGSMQHGYEFVAPLDRGGHLAPQEWRRNRELCTVTHFAPGEEPRHGRLVYRRGGSWAFDYDPGRDDDDEVGYRLTSHRFNIGAYISFAAAGQDDLCYRVASVHSVF